MLGVLGIDGVLGMEGIDGGFIPPPDIAGGRTDRRHDPGTASLSLLHGGTKAQVAS